MSLIHRLRKRLLGRWLQRRERRAAKQTRDWEWGGIRVKILPGVFHPGLFYSTGLLLEVLKQENLADQKVLELGCGSGLISVFAAKQGALVTASDISASAVECTRQNAGLNKVEISLRQSDLFTGFSRAEVFNFVLINPPYYPRNPETESEYAWYCGEGHTYFKRLFSGLPAFSSRQSRIFMSLSEDCDLPEITRIAEDHNFLILRVQAVKRKGEETVVYRLVHQN